MWERMSRKGSKSLSIWWDAQKSSAKRAKRSTPQMQGPLCAGRAKQANFGDLELKFEIHLAKSNAIVQHQHGREHPESSQLDPVDDTTEAATWA